MALTAAAVGASRRQVLGSVMLEALAVGLLGFALARLLPVWASVALVVEAGAEVSTAAVRLTVFGC